MSPEEQLLRAFIAPERQARYLALVARPNQRRKLTDTLAHLRDLDPRYSEQVPPAQQTPKGIEALLRTRAAPDRCYLISESRDVDGCELSLSEALAATVGYGMGTLISWVPGRLGYYEGEEPGSRYILARPAA